MKNYYLFISSALIGVASICGMIVAGGHNKSAGRNNRTINSYKTSVEDQNSEERGSTPDGQRRYNMLKDPLTGLIPADAHEKERLFVEEQIKKNKKTIRLSPNGYSLTGPNNQGGRTRAIAYDVNNKYILAAGVTGGMFRSVDGGNTWTNTTIPDADYVITCIAQDPRPGYQNIWYYGTGEPNSTDGSNVGNNQHINQNNTSIPGDGLWQSSDSGKTWIQITNPLTEPNACTQYINRVAVDSSTGNVYVAASGGIYQGVQSIRYVGHFIIHYLNWSCVLGTQGDENQSDWTDVVVSPGGWVFAAFSGVVTGGNDGVWESTSGGSGTWTHLSGTGSSYNPSTWGTQNYYGRIVLGLIHCDQTIFDDPISLYVAYSHYTNYNYTDNGVSLFKLSAGTKILGRRLVRTWLWTDNSANLPTDGNTTTQYDYCFTLQVMPKVGYNDPDVVFLGGRGLYYSNNGFATPGNYTEVTSTHSDNHITVVNPSNQSQMLLGCDGGIYKGNITYNSDGVTIAGISWAALTNGYVTSQSYCVNLNQNISQSTQYIAAMQDNGTYLGSGANVWSSGYGCDGWYCALDASGNYYSSGNCAYLEVNGRDISFPPGLSTLSYPALAFAAYPFILDQSNSNQPNVIYYSAWDTQNDNGIILIASDALTIPNNTGTGWAVLPTALESPATALVMSSGNYINSSGGYNTNTVLYAGTQNGAIYRISDPQNYFGQFSSVEIRQPQSGDGCITSIAVDPSNPNNVIFTEGNYNSLMGVGYTITAVTSNSPQWYYETGNLNSLSIRSSAIAEGPSGMECFVGTSAGLYSLAPGGIVYNTSQNNSSPVWNQEGSGTVGFATVNSLSYRLADNKLLVGTFGNGIYLGTLGTVSKPIKTNSTAGSDGITSDIKLYPNPCKAQNTTVELVSAVAVNELVTIMDAYGRILYTCNSQLVEGNNKLILPTSTFATGIYFVRVGDLPAEKMIVAH